jgi:hypothetical protein
MKVASRSSSPVPSSAFGLNTILPFGLITILPFGLSTTHPFGLSTTHPFGLSLSKPRARGPFDKLRENGGEVRRGSTPPSELSFTLPVGLSTTSLFGLSTTSPFGLSLSKPCARGPFDRLRANGGEVRLIPHPFGLSLSKPPRAQPPRPPR